MELIRPRFVKNLLQKSKMGKKVLVIDFEKELLNEERGSSETSPDMASYLDSPDQKFKCDVFERTFHGLKQ